MTLKSQWNAALAIAILLPSVASAQIGAAVERSAQRAAAQAAERATVQRATMP